MRHHGVRAFSLVEVVVALAVFAFVIVSLMGLFSLGLKTSRESEGTLQAADLASLLVSTLQAAPTNSPTSFAIPSSALTNSYPTTAVTSYVGYDGLTTNSANAAYQISYQAGTNSAMGSGIAQVYLMLSWPPQANPQSTATERYEMLTYIPIP